MNKTGCVTSPSFVLPRLGLTNSLAPGTLLPEEAQKEDIMTCTRCQGCMAKDHFIDLLESANRLWMAGWRCLNCGNVFDPVMERNRLGLEMAGVVSVTRVLGHQSM